MKGMLIKVERAIDERFKYFDLRGELCQARIKASGRVKPDKQPGYNYIQLYLRNGREVATVDCPSPEQLRQAAQLLIGGHVRDLGGARQVLRKLLSALRGDPVAQSLARQL